MRLQRRFEHGSITVEYVLLLTVVVVPAVPLAVLAFGRIYLWYVNFLNTVSLPTP